MNISKFAKLNGVTPRMLRYWGKKGLITPMFINPHNNYREYDYEKQALTVHKIVFFKNLGFTLSQIRNILDSNLREFTLSVAKKRMENIKDQMRILKRKERVVQKLQESIRKRGKIITFTQETLEPFPIYIARFPYLDYSKIAEQIEWIKSKIRVRSSASIIMYLDRYFKPFKADMMIGIIPHKHVQQSKKNGQRLNFRNYIIPKPYSDRMALRRKKACTKVRKKWILRNEHKPGKIFVSSIPRLKAYTYDHLGSFKELHFIYDELNKESYNLKGFHLAYPVFEINYVDRRKYITEELQRTKIVFPGRIL